MRLSVVTVCRNAAATIGHALESFFRQDHADKELIVVDGASSDGTATIARSFAAEGVTVISEPDGGLYEAMNKGLKAFSGEAIGFLNADDRFHDTTALSVIAGALESADIAYGDLEVVAARGGQVVRRWRSAPWRPGAFRRGWMPPHPTFYCRRRVVDVVGPFDTRYRIAADYDFMLRAMELGGFVSAHAPRTLVQMAAGGRSTKGVRARVLHNLEALDSRRRWLGAGVIDYALLAKPLSKVVQFAVR